MSSALVNYPLRTRIRHLRDRRMEKADEAAAIGFNENRGADDSIQRQMEAERESSEDRFVNPRSGHDVVPDMSDHVPFDDAVFAESDQSLKKTHGWFIREEPW